MAEKLPIAVLISGSGTNLLNQPAIQRGRAEGLDLEGPIPADTLMTRARDGEFDAVVALYHDQGLIPVKLLDAVGGDPAVNVTLGLPIVRTSPDHGVAYDIAGRGVATDLTRRLRSRLGCHSAPPRYTRWTSGFPLTSVGAPSASTRP